MPLRHAATALPIALLVGCGPVDATVFDGPSALRFDGSSSCVVAQGDPAMVGVALTVEAWIRTGELGLEGPVISLGEGATLWADPTHVGFGPPANPSTGWKGEASVYDGAWHHIAGTWSVDQGGEVYVDGEPVGSGEGWDTVPSYAKVEIGCRSGGSTWFQGSIDEVRISNAIRYSDAFNPRVIAFETDGDTLALWHFDEGTGKLARDEKDRFPATIEGAEWVEGFVDDDHLP